MKKTIITLIVFMALGRWVCKTNAQNIDPASLGWPLTFEDNFDSLSVSSYGPVGPGGTTWMAHTPYGGDFGSKLANPAPGFPFTIDSSILRIETRFVGTDKCDPWLDWRGGLLSSLDAAGNGFQQKYGYFECRAKFPPGPGTWPAFWLLDTRRVTQSTRPTKYPEFDVVEHYGIRPERYTASLHLWNPHNHQWQRNPVCTELPGKKSCLTEEFHTYGVLITPSVTIFYFDRQEWWKIATPPEARQSVFVMVDLVMGPKGSNPTCEAADSNFMYIDYVKVWQTTAPTCLLNSPADGQQFDEGSDITMTVESTASAGRTVSQVAFFKDGALLGTDTSAPYSFTWTNVPKGNYIISAEATDNTGETGISADISIKVGADAKIVQSSPIADGAAEAVWNTAAAHSIDNAVIGAANISGPSDFSGTWKSFWDYNNLYILAEITDDVLNEDSAFPFVSDNDALDVVIDADNGREATKGADDFLFQFGWRSSGNCDIREIFNNATTGVVAKCATTANGYLIEASIPWSTIGVHAPAAGVRLGLDVRPNDDDDGGGRDSQMAWYITDGSNWNIPKAWASVLLEVPPADYPDVSISSPVQGATFTAGNNITISANAADSNGTITKVDFLQEGVLLGTDNSAPYTYTWSNAPAGGYALTARATDNSGAATTSIPVDITIFSGSSTNYVQDPGLESGNTTPYWDDGWGTYAASVTDQRTGNFCLKVEKNGGGHQIVTGLLPKMHYKLRGWLKAENAGSVGFLGVKNHGGGEVNVSTTSDTYTELSLDFTTGPGRTTAEIYLYRPNSGTGAFFGDDFEVVENNTSSSGDTTTTVIVNQRQNGGVWNAIGTFNFNSGTSGSVKIRTDATNGYVIADAVRFSKNGQSDIILDSENPTGITAEGSWSSSTFYPDYTGSNYWHDGNTAKGTKSVTFIPDLPVSGDWTVYMFWNANFDRASNVPVDILHRNVTGSRRAIVNSVLDAETLIMDEFIVYPNPFSSGDFVVRYNGVIDKGTYLRILNLSGKEVLRMPVTERKINISTKDNLTPGIYLVRIESAGQSIKTKRLIVE